jgi:hypothetical protein
MLLDRSRHSQARRGCWRSANSLCICSETRGIHLEQAHRIENPGVKSAADAKPSSSGPSAASGTASRDTDLCGQDPPFHVIGPLSHRVNESGDRPRSPLVAESGAGQSYPQSDCRSGLLGRWFPELQGALRSAAGPGVEQAGGGHRAAGSGADAVVVEPGPSQSAGAIRPAGPIGPSPPTLCAGPPPLPALCHLNCSRA